jgi:hypothetical protein
MKLLGRSICEAYRAACRAAWKSRGAILGETALSLATQEKQAKIIELLRAHGAE